MDYPLPLVTVDAVLLTLRAGGLEIALHQRDRAPYKDAMALPGGVVHVDEDASTEASIRRVLRDKTGFEPRYLEQLQVFSGPGRDPRKWSLSVSYVALVPAAELEAATQAGFRFVSVDALPPWRSTMRTSWRPPWLACVASPVIRPCRSSCCRSASP